MAGNERAVLDVAFRVPLIFFVGPVGFQILDVAGFAFGGHLGIDPQQAEFSAWIVGIRASVSLRGDI